MIQIKHAVSDCVYLDYFQDVIQWLFLTDIIYPENHSYPEKHNF